jgi:hypothetical protein
LSDAVPRLAGEIARRMMKSFAPFVDWGCVGLAAQVKKNNLTCRGPL